MPSSSQTHVLIADDNPAIRASLTALISSQEDMDVVAEAADGSEAVDLALSHRPEVILMDVQMPILSGLDAARMLMKSSAPPKIIMLTVFDFDEYVYDALHAGATGFLLKNSSPATILDAVRSCSFDASLLSPHITQRLIEKLAPRKPDALVNSLTKREKETLILIGKGMTNAELAQELFITETSARTYVSRIMAKLNISSRAQLVIFAYENGLV